jgi:hypothetical protein
MMVPKWGGMALAMAGYNLSTYEFLEQIVDAIYQGFLDDSCKCIFEIIMILTDSIGSLDIREGEILLFLTTQH